MILLPAIDLLDGRCVRLRRGDFGTAHQVAADPLETARRFQKAGPCHHGAGHGQGEFHGILCAGKNGFRQRTHSSCCKRANQAHQNHASPDNIQQGFRLLFQLII